MIITWIAALSTQVRKQAMQFVCLAEEFYDNFNCNNASSDNECCICLERIKYNRIAVPDCCEHTFCLRCIKQWSRRVNTCPVDRKMYRLIHVRDTEKTVVYEMRVFDRTTQHCQICRTDNERKFFTRCEHCFNRLHQECRGCGLVAENIQRWLCSYCDVKPTYDLGSERLEREQREARITVESRENRMTSSELRNVHESVNTGMTNTHRFIRGQAVSTDIEISPSRGERSRLRERSRSPVRTNITSRTSDNHTQISRHSSRQI